MKKLLYIVTCQMCLHVCSDLLHVHIHGTLHVCHIGYCGLSQVQPSGLSGNVKQKFGTLICNQY